MPKVFRKTYSNNLELLIWQITESEEELQKNLQGKFEIDSYIDEISSKEKRIEFLAGRNAIFELTQELNLEVNSVYKDSNGKPHLMNSDWQMSISHSLNFIAVVLHPFLQIGVDLEKPSSKIFKVIPRICTTEEQEFIGNDLAKATIVWCAKECLYKLYGLRGVDFKSNLKIFINEKGLQGEIIMPEYHKVHNFFIENIEEYWLLIAY